MEKKKERVNRSPLIDRYRCRDCDACLDLCPEVFRKNNQTGCIEVADLSKYPEEAIQEIMTLCPADCITWNEP